MTRAEELAHAHWGYIEGILAVHNVTIDEITACGYHYKTAFVHGYKHALQDNEKLAELKSLLAESGGLGDK